jgi:hypothetical protein
MIEAPAVTATAERNRRLEQFALNSIADSPINASSNASLHIRWIDPVAAFIARSRLAEQFGVKYVVARASWSLHLCRDFHFGPL